MAHSVDIEKQQGADLDASSSNDRGSVDATASHNENAELKRDMKPRHVMMFSIACAIGTGLVIGSGTGLARGGPGSMLIAYIMIGAAVFFVMTALGEMAAFVPMNKGFGGYASRMVDPAFGYATGWNYFFKYIVATPTNLTAAGLVIRYWRPDLNVGIWIAVFGVCIIAINVLNVKYFGEFEFWMASAKVIVMIVMIFSCFVIACGGGPNRDATGFRYWNDPGAFKEYLFKGDLGRFVGFWACLIQAVFAYTGTEVVGMTFGEVKNPRKNIPIAVKQTFWRIACFYILGILFLGMTVPSNSDQLLGALKKGTSGDASPFVVAMNLAGVARFGDVINGSLLIFTLSAACTDIYCSSRSLYGLARDGQAPAIFGKTLSSGAPIYAVGLSSMFVALGFMNVAQSAATVFTYLTSVLTIFALLNWIAILISHLRFRAAIKAQGITLSDLPYVGFLQPYGTYYSLFISILVVIFNGYDAFVPVFKVDTFITKYIGTVLFLLNIIFWKFYKKTKMWDPSEVDLVTGRREAHEAEDVADEQWNEGFWKKTVNKFKRK
ncbi:hypothetical protein PspLS_02204 [Pyricularia sp. CBS 133598]|nr:hypothetical protein PspLS_02204 [Pyricularia sp. CBS 133598]